jgi:hypothetical protein
MPTSLSQVPHFTTQAQVHGTILRSMSLFYHTFCKSKIAGLLRISLDKIILYFYTYWISAIPIPRGK